MKQSNPSSCVNLNGRNLLDSDNILSRLDNPSSIEEIDLSNNKLTRLPDDLSHFTNLSKLNLSSNNFDDYHQLAISLSTLPNLMDLRVNLSNQEQALEILTNLPKLLFLNGKSTQEDTPVADIDESEISLISLNDEIKNFDYIFQKVYEKIKSLRDNTELFLFDFQNLLKKEIASINQSVDNNIPNYIYATNVLRSKIEIYTFFQNRIVSLMEKRFDNQLLAILKETINYIQDSQTNLVEVIFKLTPKIEARLENNKKEYNLKLKENEKLYVDKLSALQLKVQELTEESNNLSYEFQQERSILKDKIEKLEKENKSMTDALIKKAKEVNEIKVEMKTKLEETKENFNVNSSKGPALSNSTMNQNKNKQKLDNSIIGPISTRILTKHMLIEIIEDIYTSKANYDKKCSESKMPKETMEQHMYTFLNQKYGLKSLIVEWASSIINGIKMYAQEDSEVCLFGKILRNELEEDAVIVVKKLKSTIQELLNFYLKSKMPLKCQGEIDEIVKNRLNGFLIEDEWKTIVLYLFSKEEVNIILNKITEFIKMKYIDKQSESKKFTREQIQNLTKSKENSKIMYTDLVKIILDFHIRLRDKYLRNFIFVFRKVDKDLNGIISEDEFVQLLSNLNIYDQHTLKENVNRLLDIVDPYNNKQITFSECVNLFSKETFEESDPIDGSTFSITALDKISINDCYS